MFESKNLKNYLFPLGIVIAASLFSGKIKNYFSKEDESDYEIIRKYLLNDSPLYGENRPKLWIHSKHEVNSRKWTSFHSRNNEEINQPYIVECVQSIINHCGNDFNICLIDDDSFEKLIPGWNINMKTINRHHKEIYRQIGIMKLIYNYGGLTIPNSFLCLHNLQPMYNQLITNKKPFVFQNRNKALDLTYMKNPPMFIPDMSCFGSLKLDYNLLEFINNIEYSIEKGHISDEYKFKGSNAVWILNNDDKIDIISGDFIGLTDNKSNYIPLEELLSETDFNLHSDAYGILIPREEILKRTKYNWFSVLESDKIINSNLTLGKYFLSSKNSFSKINKLPTIMSI